MCNAHPCPHGSNSSPSSPRSSGGILLPEFHFREAGVAPRSPAADIIEDEHEVAYVIDLPGIRADEIEIVAHAGLLHVMAERRFERQERREKFTRVERSYGAFARTFRIPDGVDPRGILAEALNGTLTIRLPRVRAARVEQVAVAV